MNRPVGPPAARVRERLLHFFDEGKRALPWRETRDPYAIWVSEVMLQQTRVQTVLPYYREWMARFPDVESLAAAGMDEVLNAWKGLGYYSRARNLHRAARIVRDRLGGAVPATPDRLHELPGVGEYTAGAVASIAFGVRAPAVDGNVRRVLSRLWDLDRPAASELRALARALVDCGRPGDLNQSLMELGATVCVTRSPACRRCPLGELCLARARGTVDQRPARRPSRRVPSTRLGVAVVVRRADALVVRRPVSGLLGGLWEFPADEAERPGAEGAAARRAAERLGVTVATAGLALEPVHHRFTHLAAIYVPFLFHVERGDDRGAARPPEDGSASPAHVPERRWVPVGEVGDLPLPVAQQRILELARARIPDGAAEGEEGDFGVQV